MPQDLATALAAAPQKIQNLWNEITPMARWEWVRWVNATKNPDTRRRRVNVSISKLKSGKRRPCCFNLSACTDPDLSKNGRLLEPGTTAADRRSDEQRQGRCTRRITVSGSPPQGAADRWLLGTVRLANVAAMSHDPPDLRASHADRDRVVDALRVAAGDGRLSAEELDTRLESALSARTLGELAELTADLPIAPAAKGKDVLVVEQHGGRYVREGRWPVPARIELRTQECRVTLDFTHAVITSNVLRIETDMVHGKLFIVSSPGIVIDTDGLNLTYSKLKLHSKNAAADPRLRIELTGKLLHAKVIEQRPRDVAPGQEGCHNSIRLPSGSVTQPNRPTPSMSCVSLATSAPLARSCASIASRSRTRKLSMVCWARDPK